MTEEPEKKGGSCKTKCCGTGSCSMKLSPLCFMMKLAIMVGIAAFAVQYFMK